MVGQLLLIADWFDCHKALYGAWLVNAHVSDFDRGYRMGRLAITLMDRLEAKEVKPIAMFFLTFPNLLFQSHT